jgi:hypothetical protein
MIQPAALHPHPNSVWSATKALCCLLQGKPTAFTLPSLDEGLLHARLHKRFEARMRSEVGRQLVQQLLWPSRAHPVV